MTQFMKKNAMERRAFLKSGMQSGVAGVFVGLGLQACAPSESDYSQVKAEAKTVKDIRVQSRGGIPGGILTAAAIVSGQEAVLYADEGGHRHRYVVGKEQYAELIEGKTVQVTTERASGHDHVMVINPASNPRKADSRTIEPEEPTEPAADLYGALGEGEEPSFYLASSEELEEAQFCVGTKEACAADLEDAALWKKMGSAAEKRFKSEGKLTLEDGLGINVRAKTKTGSKLVELFLKIARKS